MNPLLQRLQPYPFERLKQLFSTVTPSAKYPTISLGIGELVNNPSRIAQQNKLDGYGYYVSAGLVNYAQSSLKP